MVVVRVIVGESDGSCANTTYTSLKSFKSLELENIYKIDPCLCSNDVE